ncbi:hypothetical protein [Colwellia sp. C1TZA3]|uniref:M61 family metallopeptidase n=1 Tax=Colwellia sp. C1TZA3 TaxID=2508879 RepID=UPI0011B9AE66|nr:hypothetical protein [Colwellia sp. C1TZA3]TWX63186.1 hypothetical protein ESZ39_17220 [Colwellia sp. C1TZA3]
MRNLIAPQRYHFFLNIAFTTIAFSSCFINNASAMVLTPPTPVKPSIHNMATLPKIKFANNIPEHKKPLLTDWVIHANQALRLVYGTLPMENFLTVIEASNQGTSAVPWGEVSRSLPPTVTLVVNLNSSLEALKADWTIYHEFSHLLIPYDATDARWFSEGLASYYQNITQARIGMFNEQTMWQKIYEGFERANKQQNYAHQRLAYVSDHISQNHNYMRIYWSGALYWLKADIALRELSKNTAKPYSLDLALKQLQACCSKQYLSATEITQKLDELSQSEIFSALLTKFSASYAIPDYLALLSSLGVEVSNARIKLNNHAKLSLQRKAIFTDMVLYQFD